MNDEKPLPKMTFDDFKRLGENAAANQQRDSERRLHSEKAFSDPEMPRKILDSRNLSVAAANSENTANSTAALAAQLEKYRAEFSKYREEASTSARRNDSRIERVERELRKARTSGWITIGLPVLALIVAIGLGIWAHIDAAKAIATSEQAAKSAKHP